MVTNTERFVEAVTYAAESGEDWWEVFNSLKDAAKCLRDARRNWPDEYQITYVLEALDIDIFDLCCTAEEAYADVLRQLSEELDVLMQSN